jgi:uncharacterized protein YkwD
LLVNNERITRHIPALSRKLHLDRLAKERAAIMARKGKIRHAETELIKLILSQCKYFAENVACGITVQEIHVQMIAKDQNLKNMIDKRFSSFGMGTMKDKSGKIYLCQIFTD